MIHSFILSKRLSYLSSVPSNCTPGVSYLTSLVWILHSFRIFQTLNRCWSRIPMEGFSQIRWWLWCAYYVWIHQTPAQEIGWCWLQELLYFWIVRNYYLFDFKGRVKNSAKIANTKYLFVSQLKECKYQHCTYCWT